MPTTSGRCAATSSRVSSASASSTSVGSPSSAAAQRLERRRARRELLAVARELEARVDAERARRRRDRRRTGSRDSAPDRSCRACRTPRRAARRRRVGAMAAQMGEARPFGQERAADDAQREARVAALQEANRRLHRRRRSAARARESVRSTAALCVPYAATRVRDLRRTSAMRATSGVREQPQEQLERGVRLRHREVEVNGFGAEKAGQIRRRGVRRIELGHRRRHEQYAHARRLA